MKVQLNFEDLMAIQRECNWQSERLLEKGRYKRAAKYTLLEAKMRPLIEQLTKERNALKDIIKRSYKYRELVIVDLSYLELRLIEEALFYRLMIITNGKVKLPHYVNDEHEWSPLDQFEGNTAYYYTYNDAIKRIYHYLHPFLN